MIIFNLNNIKYKYNIEDNSIYRNKGIIVHKPKHISRSIEHKEQIENVVLTFFSTYSCNLKCSYCYENRKHLKNSFMSPEEYIMIYEAMEKSFPKHNFNLVFLAESHFLK